MPLSFTTYILSLAFTCLWPSLINSNDETGHQGCVTQRISIREFGKQSIVCLLAVLSQNCSLRLEVGWLIFTIKFTKPALIPVLGKSDSYAEAPRAYRYAFAPPTRISTHTELTWQYSERRSQFRIGSQKYQIIHKCAQLIKNTLYRIADIVQNETEIYKTNNTINKK